jgi:hypothetical protein
VLDNTFPLLDEVPHNTTDYISETNAGDKQGVTFATPSFPAGSTVQCHAYDAVALNISSGNMKLGIREGGVDYPKATAEVLTSSYDCYVNILEEDPATTDPWTTSDNPEAYVEATA